MPTPNKGESKEDFVKRCIPIVIKDGTAKDNKQAVAVCYSMYDQKKSVDSVVKMMGMMDDMSGEDYARQECWDCQQAAQALQFICSMCMSEVDEPDDIQSLANIMRSLMEFINGEIQEMVLAAKQGENYEKTVPAQIKDKLDLSYVKSLHVDIPEKDLAVKYVSKDTIRHPVFLWGNPQKTDLENEYFTKDTDFWDSVIAKSERPLTWDHAQDPDFDGNPLIGKTVEWEDNDIGRFAISVLDKSHKYRKAIDTLIESKSLGSAAVAFPILGASSDSAPQYVKRVKVGKSIWLARWPWFATALTPTPCEPRMISSDGKGVDFVKSLGITLPDNREDWEGEMAILDYFKVKYQIGD